MTIHTVETADDLEPAPGRDRETIATLLSEGAPAVAWVEPWLCDSKDIVPAHAHPQLFVGEVHEYSEKAICLEQPGRDPAYLPKSASEAFVLADGVERVETPQRGLADFEVDP